MKTNKQLKPHPLAEIMPAMTADEFAGLGKSIDANGQLESVKLLDGMILDGRHRYKWLRKQKQPVEVETVNASDAGALVDAFNIRRRHLSASQLAVCAAAFAAKRAELLDACPQTTDDQKTPGRPKTSRRENIAAAADAFGVSERTVADADAVEQNGSAALKRAVRVNSLSVRKGAMLSKLPKSKQDSVLSGNPSAINAEIARLTSAAPSKRTNGNTSASYDRNVERALTDVVAAIGRLHKSIDDRKSAGAEKRPAWHDDLSRVIKQSGGASFASAVREFTKIWKTTTGAK